MKLVVDANVLFSFFKKGSTTRELILFIKIVPKDLFEGSLSMAEKILSSHLKDVPYVALSLFFKSKGHEIGLWSNEKRLKKIEKYGIKAFSTSDLISLLAETRT